MTRPLFLSLAASVAFGLTACNRHEPGGTVATGLPTVDVTVARVVAREMPQTRPLPGTVQAVSRATVAARIMGTVQSATFNIGQRVHAGDVLVQLSAEELVAQLTQSRAALDLAEREYHREAELLKRDASTAELVRNLDDQRRIAAARVEAAAARLNHAQVIAPFDGVVTRRMVEPGDLAAPGTPLLALEGDELEVEIAVPSALAPAAVDQPILIDLGGTTVTGTVREASPTSDPATRTRLVRLALPADPAAQPGQFVRVHWPESVATILTVPASALSPFGQLQRVFVAADNRAGLRFVKLGDISGQDAVVLAGLNAGETVITHPPALLRDGQSLNVIP